jgi:hypothetical protein
MNLTANFTLEEMTRSTKAEQLNIPNTPAGEVEIANLKALCEHVLQPVRDIVGTTIHVNSGYRCPALNKAVGGVAASQHTKGQAADIYAKGMLARDLFNKIIDMKIAFDQLILYPAFVHVGYNGAGNRNQVLYAKGVRP